MRATPEPHLQLSVYHRKQTELECIASWNGALQGQCAYRQQRYCIPSSGTAPEQGALAMVALPYWPGLNVQKIDALKDCTMGRSLSRAVAADVYNASLDGTVVINDPTDPAPHLTHMPKPPRDMTVCSMQALSSGPKRGGCCGWSPIGTGDRPEGCLSWIRYYVVAGMCWS